MSLPAGATLQYIVPSDQWIFDDDGNLIGIRNPRVNGADLLITAVSAADLTGDTLAANVVNASLNSITPSGGLLDVQGSVWAKLPGAQNTTPRGLRYGITGSSTVYGGSEMNLDSGEVRHTAGFGGYGGFHTWYANGNLKATLNDTGLYLYGTQTITANSASAALDVVQNGAGYAISANKFIGIAGSSDVILGLNNTTPSTGRYWLVNSNADGTLSLGVAGVGDYVVLSQSGSLFSANSSSPTLTVTQSGAGPCLRLTGLPTSATGLSAGDIWNDSGTLKVA